MRRLWMGFAVVVLVTASLIAAGPAAATPAVARNGGSSSASGRPTPPSWKLVPTGSDSHFRGLSVVNRKVVWLGGYTGTILKTTDGGTHWQDVSPAGADTLQFRDITAFSATRAVAMAAGSGTDSRLYATTDGGRSWTLSYENTNASAFFDCMSFYDPRHGLVMSDPVDGKFRILSTSDGGRHWRVLPNAGMPAALTGEAGFAASGECLTTSGHDAWFGSGGGATARIFHSRDGGRHWTVQDSTIASTASGGVFGLAFRTPRAGIAVGGDFSVPAGDAAVAATSILGRPWRTAGTQPSGYRSGVTWLPHTTATAVSVGLTGSDVSYDGGRHWQTFDTGQFDTVSCSADGSCWASGDLGRVAKLAIRTHR